MDLFAQAELPALPTMPVFPPRLEDLTPGSLIDIVIQTTQYTGLFNAAGVPCTAQERTSQHRGRCPLLAEVDPATFVPAALRVTSGCKTFDQMAGDLKA